MPSLKEDVELLKAYLKELQKRYEVIWELSREDFNPPSDDIPTTSQNEERVARLADDNGFDGSLFRNLTKNDDPTSLQSIRHLEREIETIPRIIAQIEKPADHSTIPDDAELLTVPQVARLLQ